MPDTNKVKFGLKNVYYAVLTLGGATPSYATPVRIPGAVNLSLSSEGEETIVYADDIAYFIARGNQGYSGDLEIMKLPDAFRTDVLGELTDADGALVEDAAVETKEFALMFEFSGDANKTRHVMYRCSCSRPDIASQTIEASKEPQTTVLNLRCLPLPEDANGRDFVKARCATGDTAYADWFTAVHQFA